MVLRVLEDPQDTLSQFRLVPAQAPTPGPLILRKEPDLEKGVFYTLFRTLSGSYFPHPLPLAPLSVKKLKKVCQKGYPLYRLLRLNLRTSKTALDPQIRDGNWPVLWHIWGFLEHGKTRKRGGEAIRKLQRIIPRRP